MRQDSRVWVDSEIGRLETVIVHAPGPEIENMTPANAERALYSDILSLRPAVEEHTQLRGVLERWCSVREVSDLLRDVLDLPAARTELLERICRHEGTPGICAELGDLPSAILAQGLIEGVRLRKDTLTAYLSKERYALRPLHNFFFMRDTSVVVGGRPLIARMANQVRERESFIMDAIFRHHPDFGVETISPDRRGGAVTIEGGDVIVAREDLILVGQGARTSTQAIDLLVERLLESHRRFDVVVQELPFEPESFIHLDMVFTFLDRDACLVYEPLIMRPTRLQTVHISVRDGRVASIRDVEHIPDVLRQLGMDVEPVACGGHTDEWIQEREQWHSGTNCFALAPGLVAAYGRNVHTIDELAAHGFEVVSAADIIAGREPLEGRRRCVVTIDGEELSRGGGGCRCMTLPIRRAALD